ncbi:limkain-b1-type NYN domain-containing protein [Globomyces pollinis-pini]|nr:limkain-b1-type NYN domain-containing protein [Globomyces pollinis-pini]
METSTVFWDHENCTVPKGYHGYDIVKKINDFLSNKNVQLTNIFAIGNTSGLAAKVKFELEESGVIVQNASNGKESAADISLILEVMKNIYYHKPPHTIVLISGDRDFLKMINFLTSSKYTVILIHSKNVAYSSA